MIKINTLSIIAICIIIVLCTISCFKTDIPDLAITNVNIIDVSGNPTKENMTILIKGNRIIKIISSYKFKAGKGINRIDGSSKYIIPGLWDMHSHFTDADYLGLYIANGVLGLRIMWGGRKSHSVRDNIRKQTLLGPRMVIASPLIDGKNPIWPNSTIVRNETEARKVVQDSKAAGADFIKVYYNLSHEAYFAIMDESKKLNIPVSGHVPLEVSAFEVSNAGQKCIEHLDGVIMVCLNSEDSIRQEFIKIRSLNLSDDSLNTIFRKLKKTQYESFKEVFNKEKSDSLFRLFSKNNTWHCPTLTIRKPKYQFDDERISKDERLKYVPHYLKADWKKSRRTKCKKMRKDDWFYEKQFHQKKVDMIKPMHEKGVRFIAGTDTPNPYIYPGFSLHDELDLLVQAGLSPLEALKTATINPAIFNESIDSLGTIETGKIADLVLLEANPLDDITNIKNIYAVVYNGKLFSKKDLEKMLDDIEKLAK